jgi:sortase A
MKKIAKLVKKKQRHHMDAQPHGWRHKVWVILPVLGIATGAYLLLLANAPRAYHPPTPQSEWNVPVEKVKITQNRLYVPRLKLNLTYKAGDAGVLNDNIWWRFPERGDPEKGGNFILAGHRFEIGLTPNETKRKSPFYHLNKVEEGDLIYADFNGKRHKYEVTRKYTVKPNQTEIEAASKEAKMTLYTCTLKGEADGREVLEAKLIETDVNPSEDLDIKPS